MATSNSFNHLSGSKKYWYKKQRDIGFKDEICKRDSEASMNIHCMDKMLKYDTVQRGVYLIIFGSYKKL